MKSVSAMRVMIWISLLSATDGAKIDIECNGAMLTITTKAARDRDRRRNTYLTTNGWLVQRFGTDEIRNDIRGCIDQSPNTN